MFVKLNCEAQKTKDPKSGHKAGTTGKSFDSLIVEGHQVLELKTQETRIKFNRFRKIQHSMQSGLQNNLVKSG